MPLYMQGEFSDRYNFGVWLNSRELIGDAVEVGVNRADFARRLMFTWLGEHLYLVDPYINGYDDKDPVSHGNRNEDLFHAETVMHPYRKRVTWIKEKSAYAAEQFNARQLHFAYIDACHQRQSVTDDLEAWWPKIKPGGVLAGHDWLEPGMDYWAAEVQAGVANFADRHGLTVYLVTEPCGAPWSYYFIKPK